MCRIGPLSLVLCPLSLLVLSFVQGQKTRDKGQEVNTFSIVAYDPEKKEWGVAVASKYLAVGSAVPFAKAEVGAVATQASVNVSYGPRGLEMLAEGKSAEEVLKALIDDDKGKESRQLGIVDAKGDVAAFTGSKCITWAGHKSGQNYTCQGNLLAGEEVINKMAEAFEKAEGPLAWRLMAALEAGDQAGGDKRGKQSAAILIVRKGFGPNRIGDRMIDLRVDDHKDPIPELARILALRLGRRPAASQKDQGPRTKDQVMGAAARRSDEMVYCPAQPISSDALRSDERHLVLSPCSFRAADLI
jgi:uncharacterized Ntn-hydrolase superfamily protein